MEILWCIHQTRFIKDHRQTIIHAHMWHSVSEYVIFKLPLRPRQDGRYFADNLFTCIFFSENGCILIRFSLKYVRKSSIDNNPTLVQIMAWRRSGAKPLSEPMMIISPTHIGVTRPQWVNRNVWFDISIVHWGAMKHDHFSPNIFI